MIFDIELYGPKTLGYALHGIQAVETAHQAAFVNSGQFCTAGSRLFVHEDIYDEFMAKAVKLAQSRYISLSSCCMAPALHWSMQTAAKH